MYLAINFGQGVVIKLPPMHEQEYLQLEVVGVVGSETAVEQDEVQLEQDLADFEAYLKVEQNLVVLEAYPKVVNSSA